MACTHKTTCPLYGQFRVKALLNFWIATYCDGEFAKCARFKLAAQGKPVPLGLLPSGDTLSPPQAEP